ncbi:hypothetical protein B0H15DRAFT_807576 [Mycena belliarum]|uniref:Uncharacterized protein n=1 Tax=Mycena belliarum TaxID=1033014 RepID=A0AAD6TMN9_9AGAR|nr:hypothetical protein B0H15DRAFT_807576 [Mycena belliae]
MTYNQARPHYTGTDSRVYSTARLVSHHGFDEPPTVDDGMLFRLLQIHSYHSRVVALNGQRWMIWSANSQQDPFYPGSRTTYGVLFRDSELSQRRYDGRGGQWDHTRVPQAHSAIRPWLGFILRNVQEGNQNVEYTPVYSVWETTNSYQVGKLQSGFVESMEARNKDLDQQMNELLPSILTKRTTLCPYRPRTPTRADLAGLAAVVQYERAVDLAAECQAGMKEKCAWITMARLWLEEPFREPYVLATLDIILANDDYLGVWINGAQAEDPLWYLVSAKVPCFVIHELPQEEIVERVRNDFVVGTDVERVRTGYEFDRIGLAGPLATGRTKSTADDPGLRVPDDGTLRHRPSIPITVTNSGMAQSVLPPLIQRTDSLGRSTAFPASKTSDTGTVSYQASPGNVESLPQRVPNTISRACAYGVSLSKVDGSKHTTGFAGFSRELGATSNPR